MIWSTISWNVFWMTMAEFTVLQILCNDACNGTEYYEIDNNYYCNTEYIPSPDHILRIAADNNALYFCMNDGRLFYRKIGNTELKILSVSYTRNMYSLLMVDFILKSDGTLLILTPYQSLYKFDVTHDSAAIYDHWLICIKEHRSTCPKFDKIILGGHQVYFISQYKLYNYSDEGKLCQIEIKLPQRETNKIMAINKNGHIYYVDKSENTCVLNVFRNDTSKFSLEDHLKTCNVLVIQFDKNDNLYIGTDQGILFVKKDKNSITKILTTIKYAQAIAFDDFNNIYIASDKSIYKFSLTQHRMSSNNQEKSRNSKPVNSGPHPYLIIISILWPMSIILAVAMTFFISSSIRTISPLPHMETAIKEDVKLVYLPDDKPNEIENSKDTPENEIYGTVF